MKSDRDISVLIVDEYEDVCPLLAHSLETLPGFRVLDFTTNPIHAAELARQFHPQLIIADFKRRERRRVELFRWIKQSSPDSRLVVHSSYYTQGELAALQEAGASRCLLKGLSAKELADELRKVAGNGRLPQSADDTVQANAPPRPKR